MNGIQHIRNLVIAILLFSSCTFHGRRNDVTVWEQDLESIREKGKITVITDYSSTDYFIYRGQPLGYQYEMLQQLANHLSVRLEVRVSRSLNESFELLRTGKGDMIAQNLTVTKERLDFVEFTNPHVQSRQVLVQRIAEDGKNAVTTYSLITNPLSLKGKTVYVTRGSAYASRLQNLAEEIGGDIHVIEVDESVEQLIYLVSEGEIPYTVSDEITARVNNRYYPNVDVSTPVSLEQQMAWAVRRGSTTLLDELNTWLDDFTQTRKYREIYARYFENNKSVTIVESDFYAINTGKISPFDQYIRHYSERLGWDWRLLASLIYQESRFKNNLTSWAGAWGLMQLMPTTAKRFGIDTISSPRDQIRAGSEFIEWLNRQFTDIPDENERIKFILASYNIGPGHISDARNLARKNGADPDKWDDNVDRFLLSKADPKYYNDPVVKFGYCRGTETFRYVSEVLERYEHYRNLVGE
ncbi:MAG TPA: transporter substrate-binding domain-containing protein [Bacteroidales bacterium]|nr:transporter substrate-binding domain-containing protein [Bacteroidales bacterium]